MKKRKEKKRKKKKKKSPIDPVKDISLLYFAANKPAIKKVLSPISLTKINKKASRNPELEACIIYTYIVVY